MAVSTLVEREVFTYGLGPEYNWLEWQDGVPPPGDLPDDVFEALGELIAGDWLEDVRDDADMDPNYLNNLHPKVRSAVTEVIESGN